MRLMQDTKGQSIIDAIIVVAVMLLIVLFLIVGFGTFMDQWQYEMLSLIGTVNPTFEDALGTVFQVVSLFWMSCGLFMILVVIWFFKYTFYKHRYTREEEEEFE